MSMEKYADYISALTQWPYQRSLQEIRKVDAIPARLAKALGWPRDKALAFTLGVLPFDSLGEIDPVMLDPLQGLPWQPFLGMAFKELAIFAKTGFYDRKSSEFPRQPDELLHAIAFLQEMSAGSLASHGSITAAIKLVCTLARARCEVLVASRPIAHNMRPKPAWLEDRIAALPPVPTDAPFVMKMMVSGDYWIEHRLVRAPSGEWVVGPSGWREEGLTPELRERLQQQTAIAQEWAAERNQLEAEARVAADAKQAAFDRLLNGRGAMNAAPAP